MNPATAAARMDRIYRRQRHVYDATRRYFLLGREKLLAELDPPVGGTVLEVGCGTGRNLVQAARRHPDAMFYGFDVSALMLETAASSVASAGLWRRVRLAHADAGSFDPQRAFGRTAFDRVMISYTLSMIPGWREVLEQSMRLVKPGGELHVVDFGQQEGLPRLFRTFLFAWLRLFEVMPSAGLPDALIGLAARQGWHLRLGKPMSGYTIHAILRRPVSAAGNVCFSGRETPPRQDVRMTPGPTRC